MSTNTAVTWRVFRRLADLFPPRPDQPTAEEVGWRLLYIQSLESARCLAEGVIDDAATADIGSVMGIGFPPWTGGALSLIGSVGAAAFTEGCARLIKVVGDRFDPEGLPDVGGEGPSVDTNVATG